MYRTSKTSPTYGSIKDFFVKQLTESRDRIIPLHAENIKIEAFRPISACAGLEYKVEAFGKCLKSLPDDKILYWFKLKQIADEILKCIKNGK